VTLRARHRGVDRARRPWSLRARTALTFGAGAALVSSALALITYAVTSQQLLDQRETSSLRQAYVNARLFKDELAPPGANMEGALSSLASANGAQVLVYRKHLWFSTSVLTGRQLLPPKLVSTVLAGNPAEQRIMVEGAPALAIGLPIPAVGVSYFEIHSLSELQGTLETLAIVLSAAAASTTLGGALLGLWASRRLVRPLARTAVVASQIAAGELDRRLPADADLGPLVESFNDMVTRLQQRIERDARFGADLSHELRSPLTTVGAAVELVDTYRSSLPREGQTALELLKVEIDRLGDMVQDLLEISRMDADAERPEFEPVPLDRLVERAVSLHRGDTPLAVLDGARGVRVLGDKRRLQRIMANLLDNADTHGGGAALVWIDKRDRWVEIAVEDRGRGVEPSEAEHIFERFYRGKAAGRRGSSTGSGLGLALAAEHARLHRGSIRVEQSAVGGARFVVSLPVLEP